MIHFQWTWIFLLLPLPVLIRIFLKPKTNVITSALKVPFLEDFANYETKPIAITQKNSWVFWLAILAWIFLITASARPQWLGDPIEQAISGRDLMLAVDLSGSMSEEDFEINNQRINRLTATKIVATDFIRRRVGDRLGLIVFGTTAYVQVPLTFDRETVIKLLNEDFIGITDDKPQTSIGDAIGLAVKRLETQENSKVLILLTDGANTAGEVKPLKAAELAASKNLKIYTIGIGADEVLVRSLFGTRKINPSKDLDEKTLTAIAKTTGGKYFRARNTEELNKIYQHLDELEPVEKDKRYFRPRKALYFYPLSIALMLATIIILFKMYKHDL